MTTQGQSQGQYDNRIFTSTWEHDFTVDGGAQGAINMRSASRPVPAGMSLIGAALRILTSYAGPAGTTLTLGLEAANDLQTAADPSTFTVGRIAAMSTGIASAVGLVDKLLMASAAAQSAGVILTTASRTPRLTPAVHDLTAGACHLTLMYVLL